MRVFRASYRHRESLNPDSSEAPIATPTTVVDKLATSRRPRQISHSRDNTASESAGNGYTITNTIPYGAFTNRVGAQPIPSPAPGVIGSRLLSTVLTLPSLEDLTISDPQPPAPAGVATVPCATITDSGYASASKSGRPKCGAEKPALDEVDTKTTYSAATTIAQADVQHCVSDFCEEIAGRLDQSLSLEHLAEQPDTLAQLIKAFCINIGRESPCQINRDIMYFAHKHHR